MDTKYWPQGHTFSLNLLLGLEPAMMGIVLLITSRNVKASNRLEFFNINQFTVM
jgi:hypothetical protein